MKKLIFIIAIALGLASCVKQDDIKFHHITNISVSPGATTMVKAVLTTENSSGTKIRISDAEFTITDAQGHEVGILTLGGSGNIVIPRKSTSDIEVPVRIRLTNPMAGLALVRDYKNQLPKLLITGSAKVKAGVVSKKYKVEDLPLSKFIAIFEDNMRLPSSVKFM